MDLIAARSAALYNCYYPSRNALRHGDPHQGQEEKGLEAALNGMFDEDFRNRVLAFDSSCAKPYSEIVAGRKSLGRPISQFDAQIAAIARSRKAILATRNTADFTDCGVKIVNPWDSKA